TRFSRDWSSDVCSSDLLQPDDDRAVIETEGRSRTVFSLRAVAYDISGILSEPEPFRERYVDDWINAFYKAVQSNALSDNGGGVRSEERRVGKERRERGC